MKKTKMIKKVSNFYKKLEYQEKPWVINRTLPSRGKCLLSKENGFLDEAFGLEWEIVREPGVDSAFERSDPGNSFRSQQQRHTGAGRFVGSRTVENDVAIPGNLSVALFDLFHRYTQRTRDHLRKRLDIYGLAQVHD